MDPAPAAPRARSLRLPRTRGDGPCLVDSCPAAAAASPHTRGWTPDTRRHGHQVRGFPAHAGMDPDLSVPAGPAGRLPRTRGDGPYQAGATFVHFPASPHTRGWTRRRRSARRPPPGFPAHAGMDPDSSDTPRHRTRLPRTRGDGPYAAALCARIYLASPHTRGWTSWRRRSNRCRPGFPAHAGMDRRRARQAPPPSRLPRTRGDGPAAIRA